MTWDQTIAAIKAEFPDFKIVVKDESKLMKFFNFFLKLFNPGFMYIYTVTLGRTIYMPRLLIGTDGMVGVLRHETIHMRDSKKWGLLYYFSYILLPIGPSGRAYWELRGYTESMKVDVENYGYVPESHLAFYAQQFTGPSYLFMFPFPKTIAKILRNRADKMKKPV